MMVRLLLRQFTSPIMLVLIGATLVSIAVGERLDGTLILLVVLASGVLGFIQEHRADRTMRELAAMVRIHADVRRNGTVVEIPVDQVVVGDVVVLRAGDIIPADLKITSASTLLVDEAAVTGESMAVEKGPEAESGVLPGDHAYFGTHVVSGQGEGVVESIGAETRFGALVARLHEQNVVTSFERSMTSFGVMLTKVIALLIAAVLIIQALARHPILESVMFALALAVGITPQMLPAIVMVSLSAGARRMAKANVLIRRLDVIEDIGAMTLLCADKTGTLTAGKVELRQALDVEGRESERVLRLAALNAGLQSAYANALDAAITAVHPVQGRAIAEIPYDFQRRRLSVLADVDGDRVLITKGAVDSVLALCPEADPDGVRARVEELGRQGFRVLALASKSMRATTLSASDESQMRLEGLLTFLDPPTQAATAAIDRLANTAVEVAVISGDNRYVTASVAHAVGIDGGSVATGAEIAAADDEALATLVARTRIFAEIEPLQKERIVRAFQNQGHTVGFLGDGINDAAALRRADVGISVESASDVAKQSAAIVVMTKDLNVIADAIAMGRQTFSNTLKYVRVTISANFGNMISMVVASLVLPFLPMLPVQILLLNLLSDAPALAIAGDRVEEEDLQRPHVWSLTEIRRFMIAFGLISSIFDISVFIALRALDVDASTFHTAWFMLSLLTEVIALLVLRSGRRLGLSRPSNGLLWISVAVPLASGLAIAAGRGREFGLIALSMQIWWIVAILAIGYALTNEVAKHAIGRRLRLWQA